MNVLKVSTIFNILFRYILYNKIKAKHQQNSDNEQQFWITRCIAKSCICLEGDTNDE